MFVTSSNITLLFSRNKRVECSSWEGKRLQQAWRCYFRLWRMAQIFFLLLVYLTQPLEREGKIIFSYFQALVVPLFFFPLLYFLSNFNLKAEQNWSRFHPEHLPFQKGKQLYTFKQKLSTLIFRLWKGSPMTNFTKKICFADIHCRRHGNLYAWYARAFFTLFWHAHANGYN